MIWLFEHFQAASKSKIKFEYVSNKEDFTNTAGQKKCSRWAVEKQYYEIIYFAYCEVILEYEFSAFSLYNNQPCQYFMERTGCLANQRYGRLITFLMENSILKIFGSMDVKIPLTSELQTSWVFQLWSQLASQQYFFPISFNCFEKIDHEWPRNF